MTEIYSADPYPDYAVCTASVYTSACSFDGFPPSHGDYRPNSVTYKDFYIEEKSPKLFDILIGVILVMAPISGVAWFFWKWMGWL